MDYTRVTCILILDLGSSPDFVEQSLGIDVEGIDGLLEDRYKGYSGRLDSTDQLAL